LSDAGGVLRFGKSSGYSHNADRDHHNGHHHFDQCQPTFAVATATAAQRGASTPSRS
jgi:hypothetical protein